MIRAYIELILDVDSNAEAADGTNEILRDQLRKFVESSCLLDYCIVDYETVELEGVTPENYQEGDAFNLGMD